jgi:hypothetical protein
MLRVGIADNYIDVGEGGGCEPKVGKQPVCRHCLDDVVALLPLPHHGPVPRVIYVSKACEKDVHRYLRQKATEVHKKGLLEPKLSMSDFTDSL